MPPKRRTLARKFKNNGRKDKHTSGPDSDKSGVDSGTVSGTSSSTNVSSSTATVAEQIVEVHDENIQTDEEEEEEEENGVDYTIDDMVVERGETLLDISRAKRMAIAYLFIEVHGSPSDTNLWTKRKGIIYEIRQSLSLPRQTDIKRYLDDIIEARNNGTAYLGDQHIYPNTGPLGRPALIEETSADAQIVADAIEDGMSIRLTTMLVNLHRQEQGLSAYTKAPIIHIMKKMKPIVTKIKITKQGSRDANSPWAKARK
eukprot:scaffold20425_cov45-Attheya_sp.AAC.2